MKINLTQFLPCQLRCTFCLNSTEHGIKPDLFSLEDFRKVIDLCIENEFNEVDLTPNLGDFLSDPNHIEKLSYLENHPGVKWYGFVTNFLDVKDEILEFSSKMTKGIIEPSIYGFDSLQYKQVTGKDFFDKFVENIKRLSHHIIEENMVSPPLRYYLRCEVKEDSWLYKHMMFMAETYKARMEWTELINKNWAGQIEKQTPGFEGESEKKGICQHAITDIGIFPNGDVSLCNCWDSFGKLILGNIYKEDLMDILEEKTRFGEIIKGQIFNKYQSICADCDDFSQIDEVEIPFKWMKKYEKIAKGVKK